MNLSNLFFYMVLNINGTLDVERSDINNAINKEK